MTLATGLLVCALAVPATASAQTVNGTAEWAVAQNASASDGQSSTNSALWQNYTFGYSSALVDRRLATYDTEVLFRTSRLAAGGSQQVAQQGHQNDLGFKVAASVFPDSPFPFYIQASRVNNGSSGDLSPANPVRSSLLMPTGTAPPDVDSLNKTLNMGGQLSLGNLPHLQLSYRKGSSVVAGGTYLAEQHNEDISAVVTKDTSKTRQSLRYQRSSFDNLLSELFTQRLGNLDYDFEALFGAKVRLLAHTGRRTTFSQSSLLLPIADPTAAPYQPPPSVGEGATQYASGSFSYEPNARLAIRMTGSYDSQAAASVTTNAKLATLTSRYEVLRGLSVTATGIAGDRQQVVGPSLITVSSRSGVGGVTYQGGPRWLYATVGATRGVGSNATPDGTIGSSRSWSGDAGLSSTIGWLGLGAGYERARYGDQILDFGNYDTERLRASVQAQAQRLTVSTSADRATITRGQGDTFAENLQRTVSVTAAYRAWKQTSVTATGGGFSNDYRATTGPGRDSSLFWSVATQLPLRDTLRLTGWVRREGVDSTRTQYTQSGLSSFGRLEYRFRATVFAVEYRRNSSRLQYAQLSSPDNFVGRQLRVSISRQFGFRL